MSKSVAMRLLALAVCAFSFALQNGAQALAPDSKVSALSVSCSKSAFPGKAWKQESKTSNNLGLKEKLFAAEQYAASLHDESFMIVTCGRLVDQWGDASKKLTTYSVRKSLISALYGIYSAEGKIDINQTLEQAGIDDLPSPLTQEERQARIVDLLRARSGVYHAASFETDFQRKMRPARGSHSPGSFWFYNNWDFNVLGSVFEKKTGLTIGQAFYQRIAKPIGMQDFTPDDVYYVGDTTVSQHPAYMFKMSTRDMARFGLLYLNDGRWKKNQIVPAAWVEKSTHTTEMAYFGKMPVGGCENLWWVEFGGVHLGEATLPGMYSAQGAGGHYILNIPSRNTVVVNQYDNDPKDNDAKNVLLAAQDKHAIFDDQFNHLAKMILDAQVSPADLRTLASAQR